MNFLVRNIGWLLLFLFFIFMLFIIATNNPNLPQSEENSQTGQVSESTNPIDELIERIENEPEQSEETEEDNSEENANLESGERQGFFARLFGRNQGTEENEDIESSEQTEEINTEESSNVDDNTSNEVSTPSDNTSPYTQSVGMQGNNTHSVIKGENTPTWRDTYTADVNNDSTYNNTETQTLSGSYYYSVNTHSLRINNIYFSETLGYLMQGDIVKRIGEKNYLGCFEVIVHSSETAPEKTGYVCEKYLEEVVVQEEIESENIDKPEEISLGDFPATQIGDVIEITADQFDIGTMALFSGDTIDQMTDINSEGCFIGRVFSVQIGGYQELLGNVQTFCVQELY